MTITHDEPRLSMVTTRRARRQLDEAASLLEAAAFAALMDPSAGAMTRMGACSEASGTLVDLGARSEVVAMPVGADYALAAAVTILNEIEPDAFTDQRHYGLIRQLAADLERRFVTP